MAIYYGSQSGTAETFAQELGEEVRVCVCVCVCMCMCMCICVYVCMCVRG